ncbi:RNA-dependent DNA polymerase [lymphocystis disease virus-China]|uniref:RNA-dependent DNA polymerase n=2 Tax=Lymphocystis disease virus 2 TaxID=159183 RepID=A0A6F8X1J2_9VIRU|nr:RNA-dependent DNA polymerase [lymphocystis disease virus-China]AAU10897.1 RNA-dependent DNA polymerase [lymphocystis disease virus-China]BCB67440.1 RNA-dependent DNA polymerase [Lymphocystis disease virus 2]
MACKRIDKRWKLDINLLSDKSFIEFIHHDLNEFLIIHNNVSPNLKWETLKAYLRGSIIKFSISKKSTIKQLPIIKAPQLKLKTGKISIDRDEINDEFKRYYSDFQQQSSIELNYFWTDLLVLSSAKRKFLNAPLNVSEIIKAVKELRRKKSPGPDGFPVEFYASFIEILAPLLTTVYNYSFKEKKLPETLNQAQIIPILKPGKNPLELSSYRPVSLLNCDYKILAKILASRLEKFLHVFISPDQTGYVKNRRAVYNIHRLLEIVYSSEAFESECLILTDAEKAFDFLKRSYLFETLKRFGLGENFIAWVKLIYDKPSACVWTGDRQSIFFLLKNGIRQGCPLSPLLFIIAMEPLACSIRKNPAIKGIIRKGKETKILLYADDVLIFVSQIETVPLVLKILERFKIVSGYSLSLNKSKIVPLGQAKIKKSISLTISIDDFIYLGVTITKLKKNLFKHNLKTLKQKGDIKFAHVVYVMQSILPFI